jgi:hypothetical protein
MALIELEDRTAAALLAQAQARKLPLETFLRQLAEGVMPLQGARPKTAHEFDTLIDEESATSPILPPLSRTDIYSDHD